MNLEECLKNVYSSGRVDDWGGDLIAAESEKIHSTFRKVIQDLTTAINEANDDDTRQYFKCKLDKLLP